MTKMDYHKTTHLPPISPNSNNPISNHFPSPNLEDSKSLVVGKRLLFGQASRFYSYNESDSSRGSRSSSPLHICIKNKLNMNIPHLSNNGACVSPSGSPATHRRLGHILSPTLARKVINSKENKYGKVKSLSVLNKRASVSQGSLHLQSRTSSPFSSPDLQPHNNVHSNVSSPRLERNTNKIHKSPHQNVSLTIKDRDKVSNISQGSCTNETEYATHHNIMQQSPLVHEEPQTNLSNIHNEQVHNSKISPHDSSDEACEENDNTTEPEIYSVQNNNKCRSWLQGVEHAKDSHSLEHVIESPVQWHE